MINPEYQNKMHIPNRKDKCRLSNGFEFSIQKAMSDKDIFQWVCKQPNVITELNEARKQLKDKVQIEKLITKIYKEHDNM